MDYTPVIESLKKSLQDAIDRTHLPVEEIVVYDKYDRDIDGNETMGICLEPFEIVIYPKKTGISCINTDGTSVPRIEFFIDGPHHRTDEYGEDLIDIEQLYSNLMPDVAVTLALMQYVQELLRK
jgi:hypothetical protein